jgi:hypothetical protein
MRLGKLVRLVGIVTAGLLGAATAMPALAEGVYVTTTTTPTEDLLTDRFVFNLGTYVVSSNTNGGLNGAANTNGQSIDFDHTFGLDTNATRWRFDGLWRITARNHVRFSYFDDDTKKTRTIDRDIVWGDYTFLANGAVTAEVKRSVYMLNYEFAFLRGRNYEVVGTAGVHFDDLTLKLSGNATVTVNGVQQPASFANKSSAIPAPLPVLGVQGDWAVSPHWIVDGTLQALKIKYQAFNGDWVDFKAGVTYMFSDHFGIGAGFERWETHADVSKASFNGRLNYGYQGGLIYFKGGF